LCALFLNDSLSPICPANSNLPQPIGQGRF
jgi:hypothetical protein